MTLNIRDIAIHAGIAAGAVGLLALLGLPGLAVGGVNALAWYAREAAQARRRGAPLSPLRWSGQKNLEAGVPAVLGFLVGAAL